MPPSDRGDVVGDKVVQFAGDPGPFRGDALPVPPCRAGLPLAHPRPGGPAAREQHPERQVVDRPLGRAARVQQHRQSDVDDDRRDRGLPAPAPLVRAPAVEDHQQREAGTFGG
jgi:hypothetical protein